MKVEKILTDPEIWRIPVNLPDSPLRNLNSYVIRTEAGNLVIDTGFNRPECREALWAGIQELRLNMGRTALFLTHIHSDHIGLVQDFVDKGCAVYMNAADYEYFCKIKAGAILPFMEETFLQEGFPMDELTQQRTENQGRRYAPDTTFPAKLVRDGSLIPLDGLRIQCIHTPGHTPGHTVLYLPEAQVLFSGDHILFDITPNISVWQNVPNSLQNYLDSLQKIKQLPIRLTLPAHRQRQEDVYGRIDQITTHHSQRLEEILQAVSSWPGIDAYTIASRISWSARGRSWEEFPPHQKWFALGETLAHLYHLVNKGDILRKKYDGKNIYTRRPAGGPRSVPGWTPAHSRKLFLP